MTKQLAWLCAKVKKIHLHAPLNVPNYLVKSCLFDKINVKASFIDILPGHQ